MLRTIRSVRELRSAVAAWRRDGTRVGLVPTMGALHDGHLTLVKTALQGVDRVVVSIFVNPTQFAPNEDLSRYPRDEAGDVQKLEAAGAHLVWAPAVADMYPDGFATRIEVQGAALPLEGVFRPTHFSGVATVVCKLFSAVTPDVAFFGEKDFQQLAVIRQMVRDLNLPVAVEGVATVREADGLALSSRNAYLTAAERAVAPVLYRAISAVARGVCDAERAKQDILAAGFAKIDYLDVCDAETLQPYEAGSGRPGRVLVAAHLGRTRLIDNVGF